MIDFHKADGKITGSFEEILEVADGFDWYDVHDYLFNFRKRKVRFMGLKFMSLVYFEKGVILNREWKLCGIDFIPRSES